MNSSRSPLSVLEWFYGALFRPSETFASEALGTALGAGLWAIALAALFGTLVLGAPGASWLPLAFGVTFGWDLVGWLAASGLLYLVGRLLGRRGELVPFLAATALAGLPWLFVAPLRGLDGWGVAGHWLAAMGTFALFLWWLGLVVAAVRGTSGLDTGKSVAAVALTLVVLAVLPLILGTLGLLSAWLCLFGSA